MSKNLALLQKLLLCVFFITISTSAQAQTLNNSSQAEISKLAVSSSRAKQYSASSKNSNGNGCYRSQDNKDSLLYTSFDGSYTALFPGKPKEEVDKSTQTKFITKRVAYRTPDNKYYYTIETNKYLKKLSKKEINALLIFFMNIIVLVQKDLNIKGDLFSMVMMLMNI